MPSYRAKMPFIKIDNQKFSVGDKIDLTYSSGKFQVTIQSIEENGVLVSGSGVETWVRPEEYFWFSASDRRLRAVNRKRMRDMVNDGDLDYLDTELPLGLREGETLGPRRKRTKRYVPVEIPQDDYDDYGNPSGDPSGDDEVIDLTVDEVIDLTLE